MTDVDYERVAREFLAWEHRADKCWQDADGALWFAPTMSWSFFGACWEECVKRGWWVCPENSPDPAIGQRVTISWGDGYDDDAQVEADPRVALPACIIKVLDAQGGTHD